MTNTRYFRPCGNVNSIIVLFCLKKTYRKSLILLLSLILIVGLRGYSQDTSDIDKTFNFSGSASITNKGISTFPNFTLGKPAAIFNFSMGNRLSFDPVFRFSLKGQPWGFILWGHYKLVEQEKFLLTLGGHPAITFKSTSLILDNDTNTVMVSKRYLAGQILPVYKVSDNFKIGLHYIYSTGLEQDVTKNNHFITINGVLSTNELPKEFSLSVKPEFYYLKMDEQDGIYFTASVGLAKRDFPLSISSILNKKIKSTIPGDEFLWNISLIYQFSNTYRTQ